MPIAMTYDSLQADMRSYLERGNALADPEVFAQIPKLIGLAERRIARELKIQGFQQTVTSVMLPNSNVIAKPDRWRETISINIGSGKGGVSAITLTSGGDAYLSRPSVTISGDGSGATGYAFMNGRSVSQVVVTNPGQGYTAATVAFSAPIGNGAAATATISANFSTRNPVLPRSYEFIRTYWPDDSETGLPKYYADYNLQNWLIGPTPDQAYPFEVLYWELPPLLDDTLQTNYLTEYAPNLLLYGALLEATPYLKDDSRIQTWQQMYDRAAQGLSGEDLRKILDRAQKREDA